MIINIGAIISKTIAGIKKIPGTFKDSIQPTVPSYLLILLNPLNKNISEIKTLPIKSKTFVIIYLLCEPSQNG